MTKNQTDVVPEKYRSQLREAAEEARIENLNREYGSLTTEIAAIPEGVRAHYSVLIDARHLHALRRIRESGGPKPQELIRAAIADVIRRHFTGEVQKPSRRRAKRQA